MLWETVKSHDEATIVHRNRTADAEPPPMCQVRALPMDGMTVPAGTRVGVVESGTGDLRNEGV